MKNNSVYTDSPYFTNNLLKKDLLSKKVISNKINKLPEVLVISTFPPKECGIASYTQDLIQSLRNNFNESFDIKICALDSENQREKYKNSIQYLLDTNSVYSFIELANEINENENIHVVLIQHEFGLFRNKEAEFLKFLNKLNKSVLVVFHTVLPEPNELLQKNVQQIVSLADGIIVMTNSSSTILENDYQVRKDKISIIPHGTHLVNHTDKKILKKSIIYRVKKCYRLSDY
ncbi:glycosyltransferase [Flavobacterium myungsuense]|uniref:glycosyltransferase n=1 Tax=Flavobacterium myungsuense TaxID=651823 RepID=UPI00363EC7EA